MQGIDVDLTAVKRVSFRCEAECKDKCVSNPLSSVLLSKSLSSFSLETFCKLCAELLRLASIEIKLFEMQSIKSSNEDGGLK